MDNRIWKVGDLYVSSYSLAETMVKLLNTEPEQISVHDYIIDVLRDENLNLDKILEYAKSVIDNYEEIINFCFDVVYKQCSDSSDTEIPNLTTTEEKFKFLIKETSEEFLRNNYYKLQFHKIFKGC